MTTVKDLPIDVIKKIVSFLDIRNEIAAAEAIPLFEAASEVQLENSTDFRIQDGKRILVVVTSETDCKSALSAALIYYKEVHLIISRSITETNSCDESYALRRYLEDITADGTAPFATIELIGKIPSCGCGFACLTR